MTSPPANDPGGFSIPLGVTRDLLVRRQSIRALPADESWFRTLFEESRDAVFLSRPDGRLVEVNRAGVSLTGWGKAELLGRSLEMLVPSSEVPRLLDLLAQVAAGAVVEQEIPLLRRDGTSVVAEWHLKLLTIGRQPFLYLTIRDISAVKQAHEALRISERKLRLLARRIISAQEEERHRLSRELHDEVGQGLTVIKYFLSSLLQRLPEQEAELRQECASMVHYLRTFIDNIRRLCRDLSPYLLEELGLTGSLQHLLGETARQFHFQGVAKIDPVDGLFPREVEVNLYRIFQEALSNIGKHAQASRVTLRIQRKPHEVVCCLKDNGRGFEVHRATAQRPVSRGSMGLTAMAERARMMGSELKLQSQPDRGTTVSFVIPLTTSRREPKCLPTP